MSGKTTNLRIRMYYALKAQYPVQQENHQGHVGSGKDYKRFISKEL